MDTILVIDADGDSRDFLRASLESAGYRVVCAPDGGTGLELVRNDLPQLVLCDILMPVVDGYEFIRRLRAEAEIAATPVIFHSALNTVEAACELAHFGGVVRLLPKPCDREALLRAVRETLEVAGTAVAPEGVTGEPAAQLQAGVCPLSGTVQSHLVLGQRIARLLELSQQLAAQGDPATLLGTACDGARELAGADCALLMVTSGDGAVAEHVATSGVPGACRVTEPGGGVLDRVLSQGVSIILAGEDLRTAQAELPADLPLGAALLVVPVPGPVTRAQRNLGWLCVTGVGFNAEDEMLVSLLAARAGRCYAGACPDQHALEQVDPLEEEISRHNRTQLHLLTQFEVSQVLATDASYEEIVPGLLRVIGEALEFAGCWLWSSEAEAGLFRVLDGWHSDPGELDDFRRISRNIEARATQSELLQLSIDGDLVWVEDLPADTRFEHGGPVSKLFERYGWHAVISLPINLRGEVKGILTLLLPQARPRDDVLLDALIGITNQIAQFLEVRQQQEHLAKLNRLYAMLSGINNAVVRVHDRHRLFQTACDIAVTHGNFCQVWIGQFHDDGDLGGILVSNRTAEHELGPGQLEQMLSSERNRDAVRRALERRRPVIDNAIQREGDEHRDIPLALEAQQRGCHSAAMFPLPGNHGLGGLVVLYAREKDFFDEQEVALLEEFASDIAFAEQYLRNEERLNHLAYSDALTGLKNRTALYDRLAGLTAGGEGGAPFALILANISGFHDINEALGHSNGDALLIQVARMLEECAWEADFVACLGGDTFALVMLNSVGRVQVDRVMDKIQRNLQNGFVVARIPVNVEMSMGVALYPEHGASAELLWQRADIALRQARQRYLTSLYYASDLDSHDPAQIAVIGELRNAIDRNQLCLHYQPKIDLTSGEVTGVEALVRWQSPQHGLLYPDKFIPFAEQTDLINPLTYWVVHTATRQVFAWKQRGLDLELSVNISVRNLQNPRLSSEILALARDAGIPLERLFLEVTESAIMTDPFHAIDVLGRLRDVGIRLSLDDFGIGQSSLSYLKNLPFNRLKIDKAFVMDLEEPSNQVIVQGVIAIAHGLGLSVTAEGIEDQEMLERVAGYGCDYGQGYHISKPMPAEQIPDWITRRRRPLAAS
ncbi:EAL domain-containing protein [Mangrovimicrobium sediminis]|uniref:EAL domain-containing protein n=1 Tax=Mangrovimicrobium sediminis TaxID=2562682 RepID=A0A4Z0LXD7_9GAMM|nr:EAL domain-containing protein [Haliea sp. SAOS-164]TGD71807.1 EAL domain-containing protein [Haliea sp. SAOS-164]